MKHVLWFSISDWENNKEKLLDAILRGNFNVATLNCFRWKNDNTLTHIRPIETFYECKADIKNVKPDCVFAPAFFSYGDIRLGQGREAARDLLAQNPELAREIEERIRASAGTAQVTLPDEE